MEQKEVWNGIATEWHDFRKEPSGHASDFLKNKSGKILDLGSGSGRNLVNLKTGAKFYLVDFSSEMLKLAERRTRENGINAEFCEADADNLPFEDDFFDAAIFVAVLHCIPDSIRREKSVKELFRVLKSGAEAEVEVWNGNSDFFRKPEKEKCIKWTDKGTRYYYFYDVEEIIGLFRKSGFEILKTFRPEKNLVFIVRKP